MNTHAKNHEVPNFGRLKLFWAARKALFLALTAAAFLAFLGIPYVRTGQGLYEATYSNGLDGFEISGEITPLIMLVPWQDRANELRAALSNLLTPPQNDR